MRLAWNEAAIASHEKDEDNVLLSSRKKDEGGGYEVRGRNWEYGWHMNPINRTYT